MRALLCLASLVAAALPAYPQHAEKVHVDTITTAEIKGGVLTEIAWDGDMLVFTALVPSPSGGATPEYFVKPAPNVNLQPLAEATPASVRYWATKSGRRAPGGDGQIEIIADAARADRYIIKLGTLLLNEHFGRMRPRDGEVWSWSPRELNRVAYVNKEGDLWIAQADGHEPRRLLRGNFTLPAWSDDGQRIAMAERKEEGRRWEICVVTVPPHFLR